MDRRSGSLLEKKLTVSESVAHSKKCPSCGGNILFSAEDQTLICSFCGKSYTPEKLDLMAKIKVCDKDEAEEQEADKNEIVCNSCGAEIIADKFTTATFCAFCGSPSLVTKRLGRQFRPDYVAPFKITKEQAEKNIIDFASSRKFVPRKFFDPKNIKKIQGIYVPFWLIDARCEIHAFGIGHKPRLGYVDEYSVSTSSEVLLKEVPFDGVLDINDGLMESIEPFDTSELKEFKTSYLQGFYAKRYDVDLGDMIDRIFYRLEGYGREAARFNVGNSYSDISWDGCSVAPREPKQKYVLFPVWLLTYEYKGILYRIAVNGQTGKTGGQLPISRLKTSASYLTIVPKLALWLLLFAGCLVVLAYLTRAYWVFILFMLLLTIGVSASVINFVCMSNPNSKEELSIYVNKIASKPQLWFRKQTEQIRKTINAATADKPTFEFYSDYRSIKDLGTSEVKRGRFTN